MFLEEYRLDERGNGYRKISCVLIFHLLTWEIKIHKLFFFLPKFLLSQIHTIWKSQLCNYFDPFCYHTIFHYEPREQAVLLGELRCWEPCVIYFPNTVPHSCWQNQESGRNIKREHVFFSQSWSFHTQCKALSRRDELEAQNSCLISQLLFTDIYPVQVILTLVFSLLAQSGKDTELLVQPPKSEGLRNSKEKEFKEFFQTYKGSHSFIIN